MIQNDYGIQQQGVGNPDATWYGINQYLFYKINCCWTAGVRMEWFRDQNGTRVAPVGDITPSGISNNPASAGGFAGSFYEVTAGLNYIPGPNVVIRPEVRVDWFDGVGDPFDDGTRTDQVTVACDFVFRY